MIPTTENWKDYIKEGNHLIGFLKNDSLIAVSEIHHSSTSLERIQLAPEGLDFDFVALLHTYRPSRELNDVIGHNKKLENINDWQKEHWMTFDPDTFKQIELNGIN